MLRDIGIRDPDGFIQQMNDELKLTDSQQRDIKKLVDDYKKESDSLKSSVPKPDDQGSDYAKIREEMEQARQSGDKAKQEAVMEKMKVKRKAQEEAEAPIRLKLKEMQQTLHDKIEKSLGEKQRPDFEWIWEDALAGKRRPGEINPKALKASVMRLSDLKSEQKDKLETLFKDADKAMNSAKPGGEKRRVTQKLNDDVMSVLTPEQKAKVTAEMAKRTPAPRNRAKPAPASGG